MRYAQIDTNKTCVAVSDLAGEVDAPHMIPITPDENPIGHVWDDGEWIAPPPAPEAVPPSVTRRQIITGLGKAGWITKQEALDALAVGARPAAVEALIDALPEEDQFDALTKWIGFTEAYRDDPLVLALAQAEGKSEHEIDEFFRLCAAIQ